MQARLEEEEEGGEGGMVEEEEEEEGGMVEEEEEEEGGGCRAWGILLFRTRGVEGGRCWKRRERWYGRRLGRL